MWVIDIGSSPGSDGSKSGDYCRYCFINGAFGKDETMEEMIESCIPFRKNKNDCPDAETARRKMMEYFSGLSPLATSSCVTANAGWCAFYPIDDKIDTSMKAR